MSAAAVLTAATVGAVAGGLLPLLAYRLAVPQGEPPQATCVACGHALGMEPPVAGWLRWGGRCARCGHRLGPPAWLLAALTAVVCAGLGWRFGFTVAVVPYLLLAVLGVLLAAIDLACLRLPNQLVLPGVVAGLALLTAVSLAVGDLGALLRAGIAAVVFGAVYLLLAMIPGANLGLGDVKLALLLGLFLGWLGWVELVAGMTLPFLLNGPVVLVLLLARRVGRKTLLPFGPAMLGGAFVAIVGRAAILVLFR